VGVAERGQDARLALQPRHQFGICGERWAQDLQRDVPLQACIARAVDLAHSARAEQREDFVDANTAADEAGAVSQL
jgi:hypothetical protein